MHMLFFTKYYHVALWRFNLWYYIVVCRRGCPHVMKKFRLGWNILMWHSYQTYGSWKTSYSTSFEALDALQAKRVTNKSWAFFLSHFILNTDLKLITIKMLTLIRSDVVKLLLVMGIGMAGFCLHARLKRSFDERCRGLILVRHAMGKPVCVVREQQCYRLACASTQPNHEAHCLFTVMCGSRGGTGLRTLLPWKITII